MLTVPSVRVTRANSMQLLRDGVEWLGGCDRLTILTYSITDGWMRQLLKLKLEYNIGHVALVLDRTVMERHREKLNQLEGVADEVYLTDSHAKVYFIEAGKRKLAIITSANATNNYRNECYYATSEKEKTRGIETDIRAIIRESYQIV